jgi:hypothetical protein
MAKLLSLLFLAACSGNKNPSSADSAAAEGRPVLAPPPAGEGFQLAMAGEVGAFEEAWLCAVYPIPIEEPTAVQWVEFNQNEGMHHITLSTLGLVSGGQFAPGTYDCNDLYGDSSLMENQIMFFGHQGEATGEMRLPDGVAATMPVGIDIIHELHYVNPTDETIELYSEVNAWSIPMSEVEEGIWGGSVRDEHINIPASETHTEWSRCLFNEDVEVLFLAAHQHQLGTKFTIRPFDGTEVGDVLFENTDWHSPQITQYDPPMVVPAGSGFEFECTWDNPNAHEVNYGLAADDEMCNMAVVHTPMSMSALCAVVETSDGVLYTP